MNKQTVILGGGLTGLGCAKHIPGSVIYEAKSHPGGHVYSHKQGGFFFDEGAHICHSKDAAWVEELYRNAGSVVRMEQSLVSNYWHGLWITYPVQNHLRNLPPDLRIKALTEIVTAQSELKDKTPANYLEWCRNQYGEFLTGRFYREYTDKYWRTPMQEMDIDWLAGRLLPTQFNRIIHGAIAPLDEKQSVFSSFHYPERGGFFAFFEKMYTGVDVRLNAQVSNVNTKEKVVCFHDGRSAHYDRLVSTIPLNDLIRAISNAPDSIRKDAGTLRHTQLIGVNIVVNKPNLVPYHWFYIYDEDIDVSRVKVLSNIIPSGLPPGKTVLQAEVFRRDDEVFDPVALKNKAVKDLGRILGYDPAADVEASYHLVVSHAYPIPTLGRNEAVERISGWLESLGIHTAGLYGRWKYVWSDQAYAAGKAIAESIPA